MENEAVVARGIAPKLNFIKWIFAMFVQGLGQIDRPELKSGNSSKAKEPGKEAKKSRFDISDTYEPSTTPQERTELLQTIKNKIGAGYYNSEAVLEDLSYGFANVMNQI